MKRLNLFKKLEREPNRVAKLSESELLRIIESIGSRDTGVTAFGSGNEDRAM